MIRYAGELWLVLQIDRHFAWLEHFHSRTQISVALEQFAA